jgi:cytochrome b subunit of formate dehydrogenase
MASTTFPAAGSTQAAAHSGRYYRRFQPYQRLMHAVLMFTFIGCSLTGLPLLFPYTGWAQGMVKVFGGFSGAATIHHICAAIMCVVFLLHVLEIVIRIARDGLLNVLWGPASMVPQPVDIVQMYKHMKWFVGMGERPKFDRYTYWEKFDYMAVFWGMFIIGGSGLLLWFPEFWSSWGLPGWMFNIATLIHGHEALLAIGFIFTIHFFNGHLRPEKFPMDTVVFTGSLPEHELKDERPLEYARLVQGNALKSLEVEAPSSTAATVAKLIGTAGLVLGILTIVLIFFGLASHLFH